MNPSIRTDLVIGLTKLLLGVLEGAGCERRDLRSKSTGKTVRKYMAWP